MAIVDHHITPLVSIDAEHRDVRNIQGPGDQVTRFET
jgi:hypothetical protein